MCYAMLLIVSYHVVVMSRCTYRDLSGVYSDLKI
jgi:hypothetical protein